MPTGISSGCSTPTDVANCDISSASVTSAGSCATTSGAETSIDSNSAACVTATSIDGADVGSNSAGGASSARVSITGTLSAWVSTLMGAKSDTAGVRSSEAVGVSSMLN